MFYNVINIQVLENLGLGWSCMSLLMKDKTEKTIHNIVFGLTVIALLAGITITIIDRL
jgi:hypothetical protein